VTGLALGLLILRVGVGLTIAGHGAQKLFGWFAGAGLKGTAAGMGRNGFKPAELWALVAGLGEFGGGVLIFLGLLTPLGGFAVVGAMVVAIVSVHLSKGFWNRNGGLEFPLMIGVPALALTFIGPGAYSIDSVLDLRLPEPLTWIVLAFGTMVTVAASLGSRRSPASVQPKDVSAAKLER
jgi:putative oxidoreductase